MRLEGKAFSGGHRASTAACWSLGLQTGQRIVHTHVGNLVCRFLMFELGRLCDAAVFGSRQSYTSCTSEQGCRRIDCNAVHVCVLSCHCLLQSQCCLDHPYRVTVRQSDRIWLGYRHSCQTSDNANQMFNVYICICKGASGHSEVPSRIWLLEPVIPGFELFIH